MKMKSTRNEKNIELLYQSDYASLSPIHIHPIQIQEAITKERRSSLFKYI